MADKSKMETLAATVMTWEARTPSSETMPMPVGAPYR
jgi:hypothetical protein